MADYKDILNKLARKKTQTLELKQQDLEAQRAQREFDLLKHGDANYSSQLVLRPQDHTGSKYPDKSFLISAGQKRKVITGGQKPMIHSESDIKSLKERLGSGVEDAGGILDDTEVKGASDKFDQYTKTRTETGPDGKRKIIVESPAEVIDIDPGRKIFDLSKKDEGSQPKEKQTSREKRSESTRKLLSDYEEARRLSGFRSNMAAGRATTLAISNPAAAQVYLQAKKGYINEPTEAMQGGYRTAQDSNKVEAQNISLANEDELDDPNSEISKAMRDVLKTQFGMTQLSDTITARAIQQLFPQIKVDTQRDTTFRGQDFKAQSDEQNRKLKASEGDKDRATRLKSEYIKAAAAEQRVKMQNAAKIFVQELSAVAASGKQGAQEAGKRLQTLKERSIIGLRFKDPKNKVPSTEDHKQATGIQNSRQFINDVGTKTMQGLQQDPRNFPFTEQGRRLMQNMNTIVKSMNKGILAEGVTNGRDMEIGLEIALGGNPTGWQAWLNGDVGRRGMQFLQNINSMIDTSLGGYGYETGNPNYDLNSLAGPGGGFQSGRTGSISPEDEKKLSQTATGITIPINPNPSAKKFKYRMINGVMTKVSE